MSFRAKLTGFFALVVLVPMAVIGVLALHLIDDAGGAKAGARASGIATTARSVYEQASTEASLDARSVARRLALVPENELPARAAALARGGGIVRLQVRAGSRLLADAGAPTAVAPGIAVVHSASTGETRTVTLSVLTASDYARRIAGAGVQVVVRQSTRTLATTSAAAAAATAAHRGGTIPVGGHGYRAVTQEFSGIGGPQVAVTILSAVSATGGSVADDRLLAGALFVAFLMLAAFFTVIAFRALHGQLDRFLRGARRIADGDFSSPIETSGRDEFAALGDEFNRMSSQLSHRLDELERERQRVRDAIRHIGEAFASGLDREALLALALRTAMDATGATRGRIRARAGIAEPLADAGHSGRLSGLEGPLLEVERAALGADGVAEASRGDTHLAGVTLGPIVSGAPAHGVITVIREDRPFTADDLALLRSLASRATLALDNVAIHHDVRRQAITDDLTGLASHGHFQELLGAEVREARRYGHPVGLIMVDIDNFKSINDRYGHQQGDVVLRHVAQVMRDTSRDADLAARYGGEEMALVLPHTGLEGAYEIAERVRIAIAELDVPRLNGTGRILVTASIGAASSVEGDKQALVASADAALYVAKRSGKNRTVRADAPPAHDVADPVGAGGGE